VKLASGSIGLFTLSLAVVSAIGACADSTDEPLTTPVDGGDAAVPQDDADVVDAGSEAETGIEAGPRECSIHGFCPTALPSAGETLRGVWGDDAGNAWAVSGEGNILRWDGTAWKVHASALGTLNAIWGSSPTDVWVAGDRGLLHGTGATSAELAFTESPDPKARLVSIWGSGPADVWAVGFVDSDVGLSVPRVYHLTAGKAGLEWSIDPVSDEGIYFARVWGNASSGVWLAGTREPWSSDVVILRKLVPAADFVAETLPDDPGESPPNGRMREIAGGTVTDSVAWVFGRAGFPGIWKGTSTDSGKTFSWTHLRNGAASDPSFTAVTGSTPNNLWAVGEYGRVRHWDGNAWVTTSVTTTKFPITDDFFGVWSGGQADAWIVGKEMALRYDATKMQGGAK
jgi:hypothetical protein